MDRQHDPTSLDELREQLAELDLELKRTRQQLLMETELRREAEAARPSVFRELDELISNVSHDLGTPLTPVIGFTDFYLKKWRDLDNPELLEFLRMIREQTGKALTMLRALALYARTGSLARPGTPIDPGKVLDEVLVELGGSLKNAGIEVIREELPWLRVPGEYLKQTFNILLSNVIRHSGSNRGLVVVGGRTKEQRVQLFVEDHGKGIPKDMTEEIFQIFPRNMAVDQGKGAGIGLATLRKISGFYGGRAWVEETAGGGCTFWVEFEGATSSPEAKSMVRNHEERAHFPLLR